MDISPVSGSKFCKRRDLISGHLQLATVSNRIGDIVGMILEIHLAYVFRAPV